MCQSYFAKWNLTEKCHICQGYLSIAPILSIDDLPLCGRCVRKYPEASGCRIYSFENLAEDFDFPCQYDSLGCKEIFRWNTSAEHELSCGFKPIKCPAIHCNESVCKNSVKEHFVNSHPHLIITARQIKTTFDEEEATCNVNKIFDFDGSICVVKKLFKEEFVFINISCLLQPSFICIIEVIENDCPVFYKYHLTEYMEDESMEKNIYCIFPIKNQLNAQFLFEKHSFARYILPAKHTIEELECDICFENKKIIFSFCSNRHTVCSECFRKIRKIEDIEKPCPFCRCQLEVFVPCKYEKHGCSAFSFASTISQHESICAKKCPCIFCCFRPS